MPVRSGRGSVASTISRSVPRANSTSASFGEQSAPYVIRPPPFVDAMSIAKVSVKCGTCLNRNRIVPISSSSPGRTPDVEGVLDQVLVAPGADDSPEHLLRAVRRVQLGARGRLRAGPAVDRGGLLARRVGERVGERDQVEEVVRVQMRDHDRVDLGVVAEAAQLGEHAVAAVEQDRGPVLFDQVAAAGSVRVLPGRRLAEHRQPQLFLTSICEFDTKWQLTGNNVM